MPFGIGPAVLRLTTALTGPRRTPAQRPPGRRRAAVAPVLLAVLATIVVIIPAPVRHDGPVTGGRTLPAGQAHGQSE